MNAKQQTGYAVMSRNHQFLHFHTVEEADKCAKLLANNGEAAIMVPCCLYLPPENPTEKIGVESNG